MQFDAFVRELQHIEQKYINELATQQLVNTLEHDVQSLLDVATCELTGCRSEVRASVVFGTDRTSLNLFFFYHDKQLTSLVELWKVLETGRL